MNTQIAGFFWNVSPQIVSWLPVRWYGLLFAIGFIVAYQVMLWIFKREAARIQALETLTFYMIIATVVGARLGHCLFYEPSVYLADPVRILFVWEGGLASHGAAIGIVIALALFLYRNRDINFLWVSDRLCIVIAFVAGCVRLGNFVNSEILGKPADLPWSVTFPRIDMIPRHPAQLYEAITYFALFTVLLIIYKIKSANLPKGLLAGIFLIVMFTARFLIEYVKDVQVDFENTLSLHLGQYFSLPFIAFGIVLIVLAFKYQKK
jgi:phosphatidylglycerol---prolipoprotein diacylglyceryl transferase